MIAIQDILDVAALKLICDELNKPTLRRVFEWKENSREWNYCFADAHCMLAKNKPGVGFIYDCQNGVNVKFLSVKELPLVNDKKSEAAVARFLVDDVTLALINISVYSEADVTSIEEQVKNYILESKDAVTMLGDFTELHKQISKYIVVFCLIFCCKNFMLDVSRFYFIYTVIITIYVNSQNFLLETK